MSYKIAVASSDGVNIDVSFGGAAFFDIFEISGKKYCFAEKRKVTVEETASHKPARTDGTGGEKSCGNDGGCNGGGKNCGMDGGCGDGVEASSKVALISDCRCIVCKKIGFPIMKQLEKKAISGFDVECSIEEALNRIVNYFDKLDSHQSLRGLAREN